MKLKYFLRGLGTGVIFGAIIMLVAYMTSGGYKLSDEEIIERAEKLGMVAQEPIIKDDSEEKSTADTVTEAVTTEKKTAEEATTEEVTTEEVSTEEVTTEEVTTEEVTTEEATTEKATTEEATTESSKKEDNKYVEAEITVTSGMSSTEVARLIQEVGIIKDYLDFDNFLNANGYSTQIRVKTTKLNSNMTYEEIAQALISGQDEN